MADLNNIIKIDLGLEERRQLAMLKAELPAIGNLLHNLSCEHQNNEDLSQRLERAACLIWDLAKPKP